jgi:AcrR family transcriptional regulator
MDLRVSMDPRVARTRTTILAAAIDLLGERGYSGFSVEGVVARTGIAKTTLYRHWHTRDDLLADVIARLDGAGPLPDTGSVRRDLRDLLARRVRAARTPEWERCMPALVEAAARHPELAALIARLTTQILGQIEILLGRGIERAELRHDLDPQLAASALIGPIVFRRLLLHETPTVQRVSSVIDLLMQGIAASDVGHQADRIPETEP